jgi:hypothetical protein
MVGTEVGGHATNSLLDLRSSRNRGRWFTLSFGASSDAAGEERYLAVERIAKELNKSERYVWKALAFLENPTKLLDSED